MTKEQELLAQENKVLAALVENPSLLEKSKPVTITDLTPGLVLLYELGDSHGCHIVRSKLDKYPYKNPAGLREGVAAGLFFTLNDDVEL